MAREIQDESEWRTYREELGALKEQIGSYEEMATILKGHSGYASASKQTIWNFHKRLTSPLTPDAIQAIKLLFQASNKKQLSIAFNPSVWTLPILMCADNLLEAPEKPWKMIGMNLGRSFECELRPWPTGGEALLELQRRRVDLAVAAEELFEEEELKDCEPAFTFATVGLQGRLVTDNDSRNKAKIRRMQDLKGLRFACLRPSAMRQVFEKRLRSWDVKAEETVQYATINDLVEGVIESRKNASSPRIDGFIGWEPSLSQIVAKLHEKNSKSKAGSLVVEPIDLDFGTTRITVGINKKSLPSQAAFRRFYGCMVQAVNHIAEQPKQNSSFVEYVRESLLRSSSKTSTDSIKKEFVEQNIKNSLDDCTFNVSPIFQSSLLSLWRDE